MKRCIAALVVAWAGTASAGTGYYVTFTNLTDQAIYLTAGGSDGWNVEDFGRNQTVPAFGRILLYTEDSWMGPGIAGLDVYGGKFDNDHIEVWQQGHRYSVSQNISTFPLPLDGGSWFDYCSSHQQECDHYFGIGTSHPDITTSIYATTEGWFMTVHANVVFH